MRSDECRGQSGGTRDLDFDLTAPLVAQLSDRKPDRRADFIVELERRPLGQSKDMGPDGNRGKDRRSWHHIGQDAEQALSRQGYADLLGRLTNRGGDEIGISRLSPPARQRHVARPGVASAMRATDHEHRVGHGRQNQRDRRPEESRLIRNDRKRGPEPTGEESVECQWECGRQAPPQHPPREGVGAGAGVAAPEALGRAVSDMRRSTWSLPQLQLTAADPRTRRSNRLPQALHW